MSRNVAVFGGSFNPPHVGHLFAAALVLATCDIDLVLVVPAFQHPFSKPLAPYDDRIAMCTAGIGWLPRVEVSRVEEELGGESLTLRTLQHLRDQHPDWSMRLVMGSDTYADSSKWFKFDEVCALAPPLVLGRAGQGGAAHATVLPEVSSTEIRALVAAGRWEALERLAPRGVLQHIRKRGLYAAPGA